MSSNGIYLIMIVTIIVTLIRRIIAMSRLPYFTTVIPINPMLVSQSDRSLLSSSKRSLTVGVDTATWQIDH